MRSFAVGVVAGAGACFVALQMLSPRPAEPTQCEQLPLRTKPQPQAAQPACPVVTEVSRTPSAAALPATAAPSVAALPATAAPDATTAAPVQKCNVEQLSEREADNICIRSHQLREQRKQAAKEAEPKDPGWAYQMETMIRQHMEAHVPANLYTKLQIECRTTFCDLKMEGNFHHGQVLAGKVANEIIHQPWSDLASQGQGSGSAGDGWHMEQEWLRLRTEEERRMWRSQTQRQ